MLQEFLFVVGGVAVIAGAIIEWRRSDQANRVALLEARLEAVEGLSERLVACEASLERLRRNV